MKKEIENQVKNLSTILEVKSLDKESRIIRGVIGTTGNLDRHGDMVNPDGWVLENFLKNPVIFVNHMSWKLPVGKAIEVRKLENGLEFDIQFAKGTQEADEVWALVEQKIMQAWSVGFIVLEWGRAGDAYTIMKQELLELSIVGLPANPDAMSPKQAKSLKALQEYIEAHGEKVEEKHIEEEDVVVPEEKEEEKEVKADKNLEAGIKTLEVILEKLNTLEAEVKEIKANQEKSLQNIVNFTNNVESDEEVAEDHIFLALNDIQSELRSEDKNLGKTLNQVNKVLNLLGKEN